LLQQIQAVLEEYAEHLPLTCRQIFYRLVAAHDYPKTEDDYKTLCGKLQRARRARMIDMDNIRDDGNTVLVPQSFASVDDFLADGRPLPRLDSEHLLGHNGLHCLPALNGATDALGNFPQCLTGATMLAFADDAAFGDRRRATPCTSTASRLSYRAVEGMPVWPRMVPGRLMSLGHRPSITATTPCPSPAAVATAPSPTAAPRSNCSPPAATAAPRRSSRARLHSRADG